MALCVHQEAEGHFFSFFFFLMIRRPPRSTHCISSAASDVYKRQPLLSWPDKGGGFFGGCTTLDLGISALLAAVKHIHVTKELIDERRSRAGIDLIRRADLLDLAVVHDDYLCFLC
eukprot:TRINITY_DN12205_c0_g1_i2.p1 TRINITY_DN12205_c0_g1~~TRINITY_DN12205_c0_g1_i2.p1  ORF type:complete len:116 (-),score=22.02 TRINITY_DN12205_c0_g1_i2:2-349(-)